MELEKHRAKSIADCVKAFGLSKALIVNGNEVANISVLQLVGLLL